jgi:hypothetical protein
MSLGNWEKRIMLRICVYSTITGITQSSVHLLSGGACFAGGLQSGGGS